MPQTEFTSPVPVLNEFGAPQNFGWAKFSFQNYDHELFRAPRRSVSEGDRYVLVSPTHLVMFEILDDGYLGYLCMSVVSLNEKKRSTHTSITPFSLGGFNLPGDSEKGTIRFRQRKNLLDFVIMDGGIRIIKADIPKFGHRRNIRGEIVLTPPPQAEPLVTNMSWRGSNDAFSYSRHSPWYSAEGVIQFGTSEIIFTKGNGWGLFDWNRGVRPRSDLGVWASGVGQTGGRQVGFNVGYNTADSALGTDNAFFLDGKLHKLDQVTFHIRLGKHVPWNFTSNDNRLEMTFHPHHERTDRRRLFFYNSTRRQVCGFFSGRVVLDDGSLIEFHNLTGFAERNKMRF